MSVVTSSASSRVSRISGSTSYSSVISRYASQITAAINSQEKSEVNTAILAYKSGSMSWNDVKAFFEKRILASSDGTMEKYDLQNSLNDLANIETDRIKNNKRVELEAKYAEGGITPAERFKVEQEMLKYETAGTDGYVKQTDKVMSAYDNSETQRILELRDAALKRYGGSMTKQQELELVKYLKSQANPNTAIYNKLSSEEESTMLSIGSSSGTGQQQDFRNDLTDIMSQEKQNDTSYQTGQITGEDKDTASVQNWQKAYDRMNEVLAAGGTVDQGNLTTVKENLQKAQNLMDFRQNGRAFDMQTKNGVQTVIMKGSSPQDWVDLSGKQVNPGITFNSTTGQYSDANGMPHDTYDEALKSSPFKAVFRDESGQIVTKPIAYTNGVFFNAENGKSTEAYPSMPNSWQEAKTKRMRTVMNSVPTNGGKADLSKPGSVSELPAGWESDPEMVKKVAQTANYMRQYYPQGNILNYNAGAFPVGQNAPDTGGAKEVQAQTPTQNKRPINAQSVIANLGPLGIAANAAADMYKGQSPFQSHTPNSFDIPSVKLPDFKLADVVSPSFNFNPFNLDKPIIGAGNFGITPNQIGSGINSFATGVAKTAGNLWNGLTSSVGSLFKGGK